MKPFTIPLGSKAPDFKLLATDGKSYSLKDFHKAKVLIIFFSCNHCPYVIGSDDDTAALAHSLKDQGVEFVAINSNSKNTYEEDSYEHMIERIKKHHFPWHYLYDEKQSVALAYGALRTPHFFVFDEERKLIYCGRGTDSPRDSSKIKERDLQLALEEHLRGKKISKPLTNPIGCNIKWEGKDRHWMPEEACDLS